MSIPTVEITNTSVLPRPQYDAHYEPGLVSDYYQVRRGYHILRRKGSATSYLVYCMSGRGFVRDAKDRLIQLERGHLALIESRTYQEYGVWPASTHWNCHWVHFDAQPDWAHWLPLADKSELRGVSTAYISSRAVQRQVSDLFFQLHTERKRVEPWRNASALNVLERILILARSTAHHAAAKPVDPRVWQVLQVIESSAPNPPSAAELSRVAGLSPSRLASIFKQNTGVSILAAVNRVRLRAAQFALQTPGTSVSDAAQRSGFQSPYSFSKWFLKQTGLRPSEYRRQWLDRMQTTTPERRTLVR